MVQEHPQGSENDAELIEDELEEVDEDLVEELEGEDAEQGAEPDLNDEEIAQAP
jgi:hypothetical protein